MKKKNERLVKDENYISIILGLNRYGSTQEISQFILSSEPVMSQHFKSYEYIIVTTNSSDEIAFLNEINSQVTGNIVLVNLAWQHSLEDIMSAGIDIAIGDFIFEIDNVKMDYEPTFLYEVYLECLAGYDIVAACPDIQMRFPSWLFYKFLAIISYIKKELTTESFRIISRRAVNRVYSKRNFLRYRKAMYHYSGLDIKSLKYKPTNKSKSNDLSFIEKLVLAGNVIIGYTNIGSMLASILSILFFFIAIGLGLYALFSYLFFQEVQAGWTTLMLFMSVSFSGLFFILAVLSKYLVVILTEMQNRPNYVFKSVKKLEK